MCNRIPIYWGNGASNNQARETTNHGYLAQAKVCIIAVYAGLGLKLASKRRGFDDALHESYAYLKPSIGMTAKKEKEKRCLRDRGRPSS